jgi:ABC-type transport system involved in multi-copper enzyme maturation permease subunit
MSLWLRQLSAIVRVEVNKTLFSRRAITVYGLTLIPIIFSTVMAFVKDDWGDPLTHNIEQARRVYAYIYSGFILGAVIFLGSAVIFTALFRGEMLDCSMHYYLLAPVRREILATGKYLAGLVSAFGLFGITTILCYLLLYVPYGVAQLIADLVDGVAALQLLNYVGVTFLGCMGYGAVFMTTGLLFRNPLLPVAVLAGWEVIHFVLPPALKVFSVIYYLKGLLPIPLDDGPLAILVAPPPEWVSILGIMGLSAGALAATIFFLKRLEIRYTED